MKWMRRIGLLSVWAGLALGASGCLYQSVEPDDGYGGKDGGQDVREMDASDGADMADDGGEDVRDAAEDTGDVADAADGSDVMDVEEDVQQDVTPETEQNCADNVDGDRDGLTDCADTDCLGADRCGRIIFGIADFSDGKFGNNAEAAFQRADAACLSAVQSVEGLDGGVDWKAVVGNRDNAVKERIGEGEGPIFNLESRAVVGPNTRLLAAETLTAPITDLSGNTFGGDVRMWTGSRADGNNPSDDGTTCADWTATESEDLFDFELDGIVGVPSSLSNWLSAPEGNRLRPCTDSHGLYCISARQ